MSSNYGGQISNRHGDDPRNYWVRLSRFGSRGPGDFKPSPPTVHVTATSSMQARMNAQGAYPGYTVTEIMEA